MIFGFSVLTSIYATALVAGLAYQQIDPIVKIVPSITAFVFKLKEELEKQWKDFTRPETKELMDKTSKFLENNQALAQWTLRKLAVRMALGWGVLALSIVFVILLLGIIFQNNYERQFVEVSGFSMSIWFSVIVPGIGILISLVILLRNRRVLRIISDENLVKKYLDKFSTKLLSLFRRGRETTGRLIEDLHEGSFEDQVKRMEEFGREMLTDVATVRQMGGTISAISPAEREFIEAYFRALAWLRRMEAIYAVREWRILEVESKSPELLMKDAEELWMNGKYDLVEMNYHEVLYFKSDDRRKRGNYSEAFIHFRLGGYYAKSGDAASAVNEFEKAVKLDQSFGGAVISENFAHIVKPIKDEAVFSGFCEKMKAEEENELF